MNRLKLYSFIFLSLILSAQQTHASSTTQHCILHKDLAIPDLFRIIKNAYKYNPENKTIVFSEQSLSELLETFTQRQTEFCLGNKMQLIVHLSKLINLRLQQETYALQNFNPYTDTSFAEKIKIF